MATCTNVKLSHSFHMCAVKKGRCEQDWTAKHQLPKFQAITSTAEGHELCIVRSETPIGLEVLHHIHLDGCHNQLETILPHLGNRHKQNKWTVNTRDTAKALESFRLLFLLELS